MIIITDGDNTAGVDPLKVMDAIYDNSNSASTPDLAITTSTQLISFVGFDVESSQFEKYHRRGARIAAADNQAELEKGLRSFLEADITKLEGK